MGENDFFLGFAGHAHTMNELELDPQKELELRRRNSPEEAQKLVGMVLDKLERDVSVSGHSLEDVKYTIDCFTAVKHKLDKGLYPKEIAKW